MKIQSESTLSFVVGAMKKHYVMFFKGDGFDIWKTENEATQDTVYYVDPMMSLEVYCLSREKGQTDEEFCKFVARHKQNILDYCILHEL